MKKKELSPEAIEVAAEWWTRVLTAPVKHDNGDPGGFGGVMADMASEKLAPPTNEQLRIFKETLMTLIREESEKVNVVIVATDYDPCPLLSKAGAEAGIESLLFRFPWKTVLWIDYRDVRVRCGYRGKTETIWEMPSFKVIDPDRKSETLDTKEKADDLSKPE